MSNNIRLTLNACGGVPSAAEARQLSRDWRAGDISARDRLVTGNLPMVVRMIQSFRVPLDLHDDAFEEGVLGLMHAADVYDPDHASGACFCTVARYWVMQKIQMFMRTHGKRFQHEMSAGIDLEIEIEHDFTTDVDTGPLLALLRDRERKALEQVTLSKTFDVLAEEMGISRERVRQLRNRAIDKLRGMVR